MLGLEIKLVEYLIELFYQILLTQKLETQSGMLLLVFKRKIVEILNNNC